MSMVCRFRVGRSGMGRSRVSRSRVGRSRVSRSRMGRSGVGRSGVGRSGVGRSRVSRSGVSYVVRFSLFPFNAVRHFENLRQNFSFLPLKVSLSHYASEAEKAKQEPSEDSLLHLTTVYD